MPCYSHACVPAAQRVHWLLTREANRKGLVTADYAQMGIRLGITQSVVRSGVSDLIFIDAVSELGSRDEGHRIQLLQPCLCTQDGNFSAGTAVPVGV